MEVAAPESLQKAIYSINFSAKDTIKGGQCAFIQFQSYDLAMTAIMYLEGTELHGQYIHCKLAKMNKPRK